MNKQEFREMVIRTDDISKARLSRMMEDFYRKSPSESVQEMFYHLSVIECLTALCDEIHKNHPEVVQQPYTLEDAYAAVQSVLLTEYERTLED